VKEIELRDYPKGCEINPGFRDGAYLMVRGDKAQITVVGPMQWTPFEYSVALSKKRGKRWDVEVVGVMPCHPEVDAIAQQRILERGIFFIGLKEVTE
jgi:hypothetical protein